MATSGDKVIPLITADGEAVDTESSRHILIPVDQSSHSVRAFEWYGAHLHRKGDHLTMITVVEPPQFSGPSSAGAGASSSIVEEYNKSFTEGMKNARVMKTKFASYCKEKSIIDFSFEEVLGNKPGEAIVAYIVANNIDIVIMGSRGISKIRRTFLGSVSDYVLHHAQTTVIITPNPKEEKEEKKKEKKKDKKEKEGKLKKRNPSSGSLCSLSSVKDSTSSVAATSSDKSQSGPSKSLTSKEVSKTSNSLSSLHETKGNTEVNNARVK